MFDAESIKALAEAESISAANRAIELSRGVNDTVALPSDFNMHDLEKYLPNRRRARGMMSTYSAQNFSEYVETHAEEGASVFVDQNDMKAVAVLNLGTPERPGHADNTAVLKMQSTAPFTALKFVDGRHITQKDAAEFLEDWIDRIACYTDSDEKMEGKKAVAAIRCITIENLRKMESEDQQFSASRSTLDAVKATSKEVLPSYIVFTCEPYSGLQRRSFRMRLSISTGGNAPSLTMRTIKMEEHMEQMAEEMRALVAGEVKETIPVMIGAYQAK